jgi:flagella basal body P-ring formation protein FlgA
MADIDRIKGIRPDEAARLKELGIHTIDALWDRVGSNQNRGLMQLAQTSGIHLPRLVDLLTAQALAEVEAHDNPRCWRFVWAILCVLFLIGLSLLMFRFPSLITPFGCLMLLVFIVAVLSLRAVAMLDWLPLPFGLPPAIPVAARDLPMHHRLQDDDLVPARIAASNDTFRHLAYLRTQTLTLRQPVRRGQPLRISDVKRPQVTAARPVAQGKIVGNEDIAVTQSIFDQKAVLSFDQACNRIALRPFATGDVLLDDWLSGPQSQQVVISAKPLEPFQSILGTSLTLGQAPADSEGFKRTLEVTGHVSLRPIPKGKVIRQSDISPVFLPPADLANRQILSLPVVRGAYSTGAVPGARVKVIISPQEVGSQSAVILSDAIILAVESLPHGSMAFVFAVEANLSDLALVLGNGKVFVVQGP